MPAMDACLGARHTPSLSMCMRRRLNLMRPASSRDLAVGPVSAHQAFASLQGHRECPPFAPPAHRFDPLPALWQTRTAMANLHRDRGPH